MDAGDTGACARYLQYEQPPRNTWDVCRVVLADKGVLWRSTTAADARPSVLAAHIEVCARRAGLRARHCGVQNARVNGIISSEVIIFSALG